MDLEFVNTEINFGDHPFAAGDFAFGMRESEEEQSLSARARLSA